jgi:large subunit ribosomal protein L17
MRHQKQRGKLERPSSHRRALMRNQVTSLLAHERIQTTDAKAKVLRRVADRMITLGTRGTLHARRRALSWIRDRDVAAKLFDELAPRYADRPGGYTRVLKLRRRVGDAAPISIVELVGAPLGGEAAAGGKGAEPAKAAKAKPAGKAKAEKPKAAKGEKPKAEKPPRSERAKAPKPARAAKPDKGPRGGGKPGPAKKTGRAPRAPK